MTSTIHAVRKAKATQSTKVSVARGLAPSGVCLTSRFGSGLGSGVSHRYGLIGLNFCTTLPSDHRALRCTTSKISLLRLPYSQTETSLPIYDHIRTRRVSEDIWPLVFQHTSNVRASRGEGHVPQKTLVACMQVFRVIPAVSISQRPTTDEE